MSPAFTLSRARRPEPRWVAGAYRAAAAALGDDADLMSVSLTDGARMGVPDALWLVDIQAHVTGQHVGERAVIAIARYCAAAGIGLLVAPIIYTGEGFWARFDAWLPLVEDEPSVARLMPPGAPGPLDTLESA
jgi:hypothetical protein